MNLSFIGKSPKEKQKFSMNIKVWAVYETWSDFMLAVSEYSKRTFTVWNLRKNLNVVAAKKRLPWQFLD